MTALAKTETPAALGHNNPPDNLALAPDTIADLAAILKETPAVTDADSAKAIKLAIDRGRKVGQDLEDERKAKVKPLNDTVKDINGQYKAVTDPLAKIVDQLKNNLGAYVAAEERRREAEAAAARKAAEEAARLAQEAAERERKAREDASVGDCDADVGATIVQTDEAIRLAELKAREAARADRDTHVKIGGGYGHAASLRTVETLHVVNAAAALASIGCTERIAEALITEARAFRKEWGTLPAGIEARTERKL